MRRDQDTINPRTRADVMVLNPGEHEKPKDEQHPYWYARVCGVFHANIVYTGSGSTTRQPQRMEFLWVRWFEIEPGTENLWKRLRLPLVGFVPDDELGAFGFLDSQNVIRSVYMIPTFSFGRTFALMDPSLLRREDPGEEEHTDWRFYYVGIYIQDIVEAQSIYWEDADKTPKVTTYPEFEFDDDEEAEEVDMEGVELVTDYDEDEEQQQELDEGDREVERCWDENDEHGYDDEDDE
ncbi:hypothetical protein EIP86_011591 [Pleurotus ostreatoroseus]|nr:hypothetical protein EIP86_011591 [Pleurotus ostreatoroseus]